MIENRKLWQRQIEREAHRRITAGEAPDTLGSTETADLELVSGKPSLRPCHLRAVIVIDDRRAGHRCRTFLFF